MSYRYRIVLARLQSLIRVLLSDDCHYSRRFATQPEADAVPDELAAAAVASENVVHGRKLQWVG